MSSEGGGVEAPVALSKADERAAEAAAIAEFRLFLRGITPRAWLVPAIIGANVVVYIAMVATGVHPLEPTVQSLIAWGADYGPRTLAGQWWRLLTSAFLHFGAIHLLLNMAALWDAGGMVERIFGHARFAAIYFAAAVCGSAASLAVHPQVTSAGASGAVFGVYGALAAFLLLHRGSIPPRAVSKLGRVALMFIGYNVVYGFSNPSIDAAAHGGGLLAGAAAGAWLARPLVPGRPAAPGRPSVVAVLACVLAAVVLAAVPKQADLIGALDNFAETESRVIDAYNALMDKAKKGDIDDAQLATQIASNVVPPWRAARQRLDITGRWDREQQSLLEKVQRYARARERSWTSLVTALTNKRDPKAMGLFMVQKAEANQLLKDLKSPTKP